MSRTLQFKRFANTVVANTTGANGEFIIDSTNHTITIHDGVTRGGYRLATESYVSAGDASDSAGVYANTAINNAASASLYANTGINNAASASLYANTGINNAASASLYANTAINNAASASLYANTGINNAASAGAYANTAINNSASSSLYANTGITLAQAAYNQGNSTATVANTGVNDAASASAYANTGITLAQSAFDQANTANNNNTGGANTGDWTFEGTRATLGGISNAYIDGQTPGGTIIYNDYQVTLNANDKYFALNSDGSVALNNGGTISETSDTLIITPANAGGEQSLVIRPTTVDGNHVHLISGNTTTVDLYLGDDEQYVKIEKNAGNVVIGTANTYQWTFDTNGEITLPTGGHIGATKGGTMLDGGFGGSTSLTSFYANGNYSSCITGLSSGLLYVTTYNDGGPDPSKTWIFDNDGTLTLPSIDPSASPAISSIISTTPLKVTANGSTWTFSGNNLTFPDSTIQTSAFNTNNVVTKVTGNWTVTSGTNTYSITVPINGAYQIWVRANIPNGIISYIATVQVTNTNVAVLGSQRAWNYTDGGSPILLTSMPSQIVGAEGTISTTTGSGTTNNVFNFGISNTSGSNQTVYWGYTKLS